MVRSRLVVTKQTPLAPRGMVAAEHWRGAEVGAGILARGGNAVDAAVATAVAMTVVEPFMSTVAGSGSGPDAAISCSRAYTPVSRALASMAGETS